MRRNKKKSSLIVASIFLLFYVMFRGSSKASPLKTDSSGNANLIDDVLKSSGYSSRMAYNWFLVSKMETGNFRSNLYVNYNNMFGMKQPVRRDTLSIGSTPSGFASFNSRSDSVKDLVLYMKEFNYPKDFSTLEDQITFMKSKGYFEEPYGQYYALVKAHESL